MISMYFVNYAGRIYFLIAEKKNYKIYRKDIEMIWIFQY